MTSETTKGSPVGLIYVELFGTLRHLAGTSEVMLDAETLVGLLYQLGGRFPRLTPLLGDSKTIAKHLLISVDGESFVGGEDRPLSAGSRVCLFSADAGG
jgi:molybdopterin converting factor small subunit